MLNNSGMGLLWVAGCRQLPGSVGVYIRKDPQTSPREFNEEHVQVIQVGGDMFLPKMNAWNLKMNPFGKGKASTPNHQLLGFQLSIFVGMLISGMCLGRIGMFPLRNHGDFLFWGRFFGIGCLLSCDFCLEFQKRIWPRVLTTRFAFFVGGLGREFCLLVPPFPRWAWFEKSKRPWHDTVEAEKSLGCKRQIHLVYNPYLPQAICLKKKYYVPSLGWVFTPLTHPVGFFSISQFPNRSCFRWRKLPDVNCRASGGSWVDMGWWVDGWFREFPKMPGRVAYWCWKLQKSGEWNLSWGCRIFFCINSYSLMQRIRVVKDVCVWQKLPAILPMGGCK